MSSSVANTHDALARPLRPVSDFGGIQYAVIAGLTGRDLVNTIVDGLPVRLGNDAARIGPTEKMSEGTVAVKEILRTNDTVLVSAVGALLDGAGIPHLVLDQNMSVLEGSLGILPRRVLVDDDYARAARRLLEDAGLASELRSDAG